MYFVDKTDFISLRYKLQRRKGHIAAILQVDNIEEVIKRTEEALRPALVAEVDRRVNAWAALNNASIQKYSNGVYMIYFNPKQLMSMEKTRFDILDSIREINSGNKIPITLSIGVGVNGKTMQCCRKFCNQCHGYCSGQRGDQAVVKDNEKFPFMEAKQRL
jgi:c-di-AMP phosphodiesterase-like protein